MIEDKERYEKWVNFKMLKHCQNVPAAFDYAWIEGQKQLKEKLEIARKALNYCIIDEDFWAEKTRYEILEGLILTSRRATKALKELGE